MIRGVRGTLARRGAANTRTRRSCLRAYAQGIFPMADPRTGRIDYYSPDPRAILPLDDLHVSEVARSESRRAACSSCAATPPSSA